MKTTDYKGAWNGWAPRVGTARTRHRVLDAERIPTDLGPALVTTPERALPRPHPPPDPRRQRIRRFPTRSPPFTHAATRSPFSALPPTSAAWPPCAGRKAGLESAIDPDEHDSAATQFGVSTRQVKRDHLISHIFAFLSRESSDRINFVGGTALARTYLPDGRLSGHIDLIAIGSRKEVANDLDATLFRALSAPTAG